jgi:serine/threonine-protein kinase RsbW
VHLALQLTLPNDARLVPRTRRVVASYLSELGVPDEDAADVLLAIDEACSNVLQHAYPAGAGHYQLRADLRPEEIVIEVEDDGVGFDALTHRPPADRLPVSGRGLQVIKALMTTVEVESPTLLGGTRLRMSRRLDATSEGHASEGTPTA